MASVQVTAPNREYSGTGPGGVEFRDGVAELDLDIPEHRAALAYFKDKGYGVDGDEPTQPEIPVQPDSREVGGQQQLGTPLRDAAVNPRPEDFLPPVNAGQADPHGPQVVAPGVHALPPGPIIPGDVGVVAVRAQEDVETKVAEAVLVHQGDVGEVTKTAADYNGATTAPADAAEALERPAKSASKDEWVAYAQEVDRLNQVDVHDHESMTKAALIEHYGKD